MRDQFDVTKHILEHFWSLGRSPDYLDIGANYAVISLVIGDFIQKEVFDNQHDFRWQDRSSN